MYKRRSLSARKKRTEGKDPFAHTPEEKVSFLMERALRFVSIRPRSIIELTSYLASKEPDSQYVQDRVFARLKELGYADDRAFADFLIKSRSGHTPRGERHIRQELLFKGVSRTLIDEAIACAVRNDERDERLLARIAAERFWRRSGQKSNQDVKRRLFAHLMRSGFSAEIARSVIDELVPKGYNTKPGYLKMDI